MTASARRFPPPWSTEDIGPACLKSTVMRLPGSPCCLKRFIVLLPDAALRVADDLRARAGLSLS
jgi:hypothetical protein